MSRKVVIEFSLIDESREKTREEILKDIEVFLESEDLVIPWCGKFFDITICENESNVNCVDLKKSIKQVIK
jgi:hypothetical protein